MTDLVSFGETPIRLSTPGYTRLATASQADIYVDGVESSVAVAASCLGTESTWLSKLPDTPIGRRVVADLRRHGIETDVTWTDTGRVGVIYHESGAAPRTAGSWHDRENTSAALSSPEELPVDLLSEAAVVFVAASTPMLSEGAAETTETAIRTGSDAGATTALDLDYVSALHDADFMARLLDRLFDHVDVFFANESDAQTVFDLTGGPRELANTIAAEHDLEMVLITRSQRGAVVMENTPGTNVLHERDAIHTDEVDETGQHEALVGGFLSRIADGADAAEALTTGVAMASLSRTIPGPLLQAETAEVEAAAEQVRDTT